MIKRSDDNLRKKEKEAKEQKQMLANLMATGKGVTIMDPKDPTSIQKGLQQ